MKNWRIDPRTRYVEDARGCWIWTGPLNHHGYGQHGKRLAHGLVYELSREPIPEGLQVDHLCRNRACVNPDHMEVVTLVENVKRGAIARDGKRAIPVGKSTCNHGHPLSGQNLYINSTSGQRCCRTCVARWQRESRERRRDKETPARR